MRLENSQRRHYDRVFALIQSINTQDVIPSSQRYKYALDQLKAGAIVSFKNRDLFLVIEEGTYDEIGYEGTWKELELLNLTTGEKVYLEVERDDDKNLEATLSNICLNPSQFDPRIDLAFLESVIKDEGELSYDGVTYQYDDDYEAYYLRADQKDKLMVVDFYANYKGVDTYLTAEYWYNHGDQKDDAGSIEIWLSIEADPDEFEIISLPKKEA